MPLQRWLLVVGLLLASCASSPPSGDPSVAEPTVVRPISKTASNVPASSTAQSVTDVEMPDGSPSWPDFWSAVADVESALALLGYENLGGDHPGPTSVAFLVAGLSGDPEVEVALGWEQSAPVGAFGTIANIFSELKGIKRGEGRTGVWFRCGPLSVEMLAEDLSDAAALADRLRSVICDSG